MKKFLGLYWKTDKSKDGLWANYDKSGHKINNVLAFPGIFRGLLDANAHKITDELLIAAAEAIASCVTASQLNASFIVPSVFDAQVVQKVAAAVKKSV